MGDITLNQFFIGEWILLGACIIIVATRLAIRTWKKLWRFWLSEVFLVLGVGFFASLVSWSTYSYVNNIDLFDENYETSYAKMMFFLTVIFDLSFHFPRFSLLAFYNELFPVSEEGLRKCLYAVAVYHVCAFITVALLDIFWCGLPVADNWAEATTCRLADESQVIWINWPIGMFGELLVFGLPFGLLRRMKATPKREQIALICIFSIGLANIGMSIARFYFVIESIWSRSASLVSFGEIASQIIVGALPALRPLLTKISTGVGQLSSRITGAGTRTDDDERTIQGSYSARGTLPDKERGGSRGIEGNFRELALYPSNDADRCS